VDDAELYANAMALILAALADGDTETAAAIEEKLSDPDALAELLADESDDDQAEDDPEE